jgi:hypothetical protein
MASTDVGVTLGKQYIFLQFLVTLLQYPLPKAVVVHR